MYSYREFIDLQNKYFMSTDEKLERNNLEVIRRCIAENNKTKEPESNHVSAQTAT